MSTPKHSLLLEQRVLENLMSISDPDNLRVQKAFLKLNGDCFYNPDTKQLFAMVRNEFQKRRNFNFVDILVLIPKHDENTFKTMTWIMDNHQQYHVGDSTLEGDVEKLLVFSMLRKQISLTESMAKKVENCPDPLEAHGILCDHITEISNLNHRESNHGVSGLDLADKYYAGNMEKDLIIPTTCDQLNQALGGGIRRKSLITICAGASVGKTSFSIYLMDAIARCQPDTQSLFFSLEMEVDQIWLRHISVLGGKQFEKLTEPEKTRAISASLDISTHLYDRNICRSCADIDFILTTARLKSMEKPISVIVVDYLTLVENRGHFERNDLKQTDITTKLALLAIELNCTVIALSQINRGSSARAIEDRCPWPHDASDSSGSHKSSTLWLGLDRPILYNDDPCYKNQFVIKCRKNRYGDNFDLILAFNEGTFAEVKPGTFKSPTKPFKSAAKSLFKSSSDDFNKN